MTFARRLGQNVARARERAGLSQEELSYLASMHRTAIGQIERGLRVARTDSLVKIAGSLGIRPEQLLAGLSWEPGGVIYGKLGAADDGATLSDDD